MSVIKCCDARWDSRIGNCPRCGKKLCEDSHQSSGSPVLALSIRQPWAWLILNGGKDIENRSWPTRFRGRFLIHAGKGMTRDEYENAAWDADDNGVTLPPYEALERGGIVGEAEIADCVTCSDSPWFCGDYGFVLRNAKTLPFRQCKGMLGFFRLANAEVSQPEG